MVTGASRGVARGIASADLPCGIHKITCDHLDDTQTAAAFERLTNGLDILVNSAWGGYERMMEEGQFT
jgi:dehydrogenase/reductase SDR family protein 1